MHIEFKLGLDKTDSLNYPNFEPEEIDLWLNRAQDRFVKTRYVHNNKTETFEETQKRTDDLRYKPQVSQMEYYSICLMGVLVRTFIGSPLTRNAKYVMKTAMAVG